MTTSDAAQFLTFLERNLPDMPTTFDEGLGIASERYSVNKALRRFVQVHANGRPIRQVLEAPVDGLMGVPGMNSAILAREFGAQVRVGSPSRALLARSADFWDRAGLADHVQFDVMTDQFPYPDQSFDWVWNYCTFEHFAQAQRLLLEMKRVSRRYVCVVTQNAYNYGYPIHRAYHLLRRQPWDHGNSRWMKMGNLVRLFRRCGLTVVEQGCVDVPPWFDTFDMHIRGKIKQYMNDDGADAWFWSSLQAGDMQKLAAHRLIQRLEQFESRLFYPLTYLFAHHFYVIGERSESRAYPVRKPTAPDPAAPVASPAPRVYDFAEGFGSVYGRYVRKRLVQRLIRTHRIDSVLEAPCNAESYFASPGTQSVPFAEAGCAVTLLHPDQEIVEKTRAFWTALGRDTVPVIQHTDLDHLPFADATFDLVWNFDYVPLFQRPARFIAEMARVSRDLVLVIVPNFRNVGYPVHALRNLIQHRASPWGARRWMDRAPVIRAMRAAGLEIVESGLVDMPPWPGFDALNLLGQAIRRNTVQAQPDDRTDAQVEQMLQKLTLIEYAPLPALLKVPFAHQLYVLGRRRERGGR